MSKRNLWKLLSNVMPELPEVETIVQGLREPLKDLHVIDAIVRCRQLRWPVLPQLPELLRTQKILNLQRRGKYVLMKFHTGTLIIHLGMSGRLCLIDSTVMLKPHDHVDIILSNNLILRYHDPRRFGAIVWTTADPSMHPLLQPLGLEPFDSTFTAEYLSQKALGRRKAIKSFLMDSHIVVGIGNIYAAECLYLTKIHPLIAAGALNLIQYRDLVLIIKQVLLAAISQGGTTIKDFVDGIGNPGNFVKQLQVYGRSGQHCYTCQSLLQSIKIGQRATVFCPQCQLFA